MAKFVYLLLDLGTLCAAFSFGIFWRQEWVRFWRQTVLAVGVTSLAFLAWDVVATHAGHWDFNEKYTVGITIFGLPIEEYLFFIVVSLASLAIWQRVQTFAGKRLIGVKWLLVSLGGAILTNLAWWGRGYTAAVTSMTVIVCLLLATVARPLLTRAWGWYLVILTGLFLIFNTVLTALPIVTYGAEHFSGVRLGTIPLEDAFYNFALINAVVIAYHLLLRRVRG
jgi:lycopene cyclase domain-containing protein